MKKILLSVFVIHINLICFAQTSPIDHASNILPPSPTAAELGKYGLVPVGLSTGSANVNIPIYTYATKFFSVPISLSYSSGGIKVDQIASWVGMGWSLNAGGVITRIVRDEIDEDNLGNTYPAKFDVSDPQSVTYLQNAGDNDSFDSEVDLYTFNFMGFTGKFVFDRQGRTVVMPYQNIKIERYFNQTIDYFVITTSNGVKYTFSATETTKTASWGTGCGKNYNAPYVTSWFLTSIQTPQGEQINFEYTPFGYTYKASLSQIIMRKVNNTVCNVGTNCPVFNDKTCVNAITLRGAVLSRIWSTNQGEIDFVGSQSRKDVGDFKLDEIQVKDNSGNLIRKITFNYTFSYSGSNFTNSVTTEELKYRMFLTSFVESGADSLAVRTHGFEYNDMNGLPPRLSFAQDHWGFFNGANNTYFVPQGYDWKDSNGNNVFASIGGNREPSSTYSSKGVLTKINYPTSGATTIQYEPNAVWGTYTSFANVPITNESLTVTGTDPFIRVAKTLTINNIAEQQVHLFATASLDANYTSADIDPLHNFANLSVTDNSLGQTIISNKRINVGEAFDFYMDFAAGHTFDFVISANGGVVDAALAFSYYASAPQTITNNVSIGTGGVRVKNTSEYDPVTNQTNTTSYYYARIADLNKSSGVTGGSPVYTVQSQIRQACNSGIQCDSYDCNYVSLYSNSLNSIFPMGGSHIYYDHVVVAHGSDFANGAEEHEFAVQFDQPGKTVWGQDFINGSLTNFGWSNGLETATRTYSYKSNAFVLNKELINSYTQDNRYQNSVNSLSVRKKYTPLCTSPLVVNCTSSNITEVYREFICTNYDPGHGHIFLCGGYPFGNGETRCIANGNNNQWIITGYGPCYSHQVGEQVIVYSSIEHLDAMEYQNIAYWFYLNNSVERQYDENGQNPVETQKLFFYDNPQHAQLTRTQIVGSDNSLTQMTTWYPQDYGNIGNLITLKNNNILDVPIKSETTVNSLQTKGTVIQYTDFGQPKDVFEYRYNQLTIPAQHDTMVIIPSNKYKWEGSLAYNSANNTSQVFSEKSPTISYLWDYYNSKPVAKVVNATLDQVAFTSFEADGNGQWNYSGPTNNDLLAKTGKYYYNLGGGSIARSLSPGTYKIEYWAKGNVTVSGGTITTINTSQPDANGWTLYQQQITVSSVLTLTISGNTSALIDELRLYPAGSQMTTYTYDQFIGMTSTTDPNNVTTYFEYDSFERLKNVKDANKNLLKSYQYQYKNQLSIE